MDSARVEVRHLSKTFGHTRVLSDVHMSVAPGEIHALVGQNGSGKSTLIKVIGGYHAPDRGAELLVDGDTVHLPVKPGSLTALGISFVHQNLGLIDHLSIAENISIGQDEYAVWSRLLNRRKEAAIAGEVLARLHVLLDPSTPVRDLNSEQRVSVAIARALRSQIPGKGLTVLDETTRALSREGAASFYQTLRRAVHEGGSVLVVAHSLAEVMAVADRVTVLRDGLVVGDGMPTSELSEQAIAFLMLGRSVKQIRRLPPPADSRPHVVVKNLDTGQGGLLNLAIAKGEIVGLTGSTGSGWEQVPYLLSGVSRVRMGIVEVDGCAVDLTRADVHTQLRAGIVLVPERREQQGLALGLSVAENVTLPRLRVRGRPYLSGLRWQREEASRVVEELDVRPPDRRLPVGKLSGGNQQKVLFGKWLLGAPSVLILHEPTQGVDLSARRDLLNAVISAAESGTSVLLVTNDVNDLSAMCRRVLVVHDGAVSDELVAPVADDIVAAVYDGMPNVVEHA